jgi:exodeoxyribonuclease-3
MLLVSWNVAGRVKRLEEQAERLLSLHADAICLQEITRSTLPRWQRLLYEAGYLGVEHGALDSGRSRPLAVLTACREPVEPIALVGAPWPERVLAVRTATGPELVNVHSPISPKPELAKVRTHEAVHRHLATERRDARILCGDLNTPRKEHRDGSVWTFARDQYGRLRADRGERWDQAELALIRGLEPYGFRDAYRLTHGYEVRELSWEWPRWKGGYRLDHLIVSAAVAVQSCTYEHQWRRDGLSDHSPLIATLQGPNGRNLSRGAAAQDEPNQPAHEENRAEAMARGGLDAGRGRHAHRVPRLHHPMVIPQQVK